MAHLRAMFRSLGKKTGVVFVHEHGLSLEVWNGGPHPCWCAGVICTERDDGTSRESAGIPRTPDWLLVLPTYLCTTRYVWLPSSHPKEIADMLEFELPRIAPCSTQPWAWDYSVVRTRDDGGSQVLVVLSPASVVASAMERVRPLGIKPRLVTANGALHAMRLARSKAVDDAGPCGYVWWDYSSMDFLVMEGTRLAFLRGVRVCGSDSRQLDFLEAEVGRSLSMLRQQRLCLEELPVHVGGTSPESPHLAERLGRLAGIRVDPACDWPTSRAICLGGVTAETGRSSLRRNGYSPAVCADLLPKPLKEKRRRIRRRRQIFMHGLRACLIVLLMLLCLRVSLWRTTHVSRAYEQRLTEIGPLAQKLQFLQGQLSVIQAQVQANVYMLDIIGQLYQVLPQDVSIHYLSIDQNRRVVIRAQARRLSQAFDCIDPLERSTYLANVRQNYAHLREIEGQVLIDFELRADLETSVTKETKG